MSGPAIGIGSTGAASLVLATLMAFLLTLMPLAGAQSSEFERAEVILEPERFEAGLYGEKIEGQAAANLRVEIDDEHGNGDGEVTADEVDAYLEATREEFNTQLERFRSALVGGIKVNERPPYKLQITEMRLGDNVMGDASSAETIVRDVDAELLFVSTAARRANLTFAQDFRQAFAGQLEWGIASFNGTEEWAIDPDTIEPGSVRETFWTGHRFEVPYDETDSFASGFDPLTFQLMNMSGEEEPPTKKKKGSPGAAGILVAAALGLVLARARRR